MGMSAADYDARYGLNSQAMRDEALAGQQGINQYYNQYMAMMGRGQGMAPGPYGTYAPVPQQGVPSSPVSPINEGWKDEDLVAAASYWGMPEEVARQMPRDEVLKYVNSKRDVSRRDVQPWQAGLAVPAMFLVGGAEAITGGLQHLPLIGDWLGRQKIVHDADMGWRTMEEAIRSSTGEWEQGLLSATNIGGNLAAMWMPGTAAWKAGSVLGKIVPFAERLSPIGRAAMQGGIASYLLAGGTSSDESASDRWKHVGETFAVGAAGGAIFKAAEPLINKGVTRLVNAFVPKNVAAPEAAMGYSRAQTMAGIEEPGHVQQLFEAAAAGDEGAEGMLQMVRAQHGVPEFQSEPGVHAANALSSQMNKVATVAESPLFPQVVGQTMPTDASVAAAGMATNPGGTTVVQGIVNPSEIVTGFGENIRFANRGNRLDVLVSADKLTDRMVAQYEQHGVYQGQSVITEDGVGATVRSIDQYGNAVVKPVYDSSPQFTTHVSKLHPEMSSPGETEVPMLWNAFEGYAAEKAGAITNALEAPITAESTAATIKQNMAIWMNDFFDQMGIQHPADRANISNYFNKRYVQDFMDLAPAEMAAQHSIVGELNAAMPEHPVSPVQTTDAAATVKGMRVIPEAENLWHVETIPDNTTPVPEGMVTPGDPTDPVTIQQGQGIRMTFPSRQAAEDWIKMTNREARDITPPSDVPLELTANHPTDAPQAGNINAGAPSREVASINEMNLDTDAGGSGPVPPEAHAEEGNFGRLRNTWIESFLRWRPARRLFSKLDQGAIEHLGQDIGLARDYDGLSQGTVINHNVQHPFQDELTDITRKVKKSRLFTDGTWTRIFQIADPTERVAAGAAAGMSPREIQTFTEFEGLIQKLHPNATPEEIRELPRYLSHVAQRQSRAETVDKAFEDFAHNSVTEPFYQYVKGSNLNFRELDARVLGEQYIRSVNWARNMEPLWSTQWEKYSAMAKSEDSALSQIGAIMQQQLRMVKFGYSAVDDTALDMVHGGLQMLLGPEVSRQQAREIFNFGLNAVHSSLLGFRPYVVLRDMFQAFLALPRVGAELPKAYAEWMSSAEARSRIWNEAVAEGAVSLQMPRKASPGSFGSQLERIGNEVTGEAGAGLPEVGPSEYGARMRGAARVTTAIRDMMPEWLRDTRDTIFHPMYLYGKQSELTRALVYTAGRNKAATAIAEYRAAGLAGDFEQLMGDSSARTFDPAWQREFRNLVQSGQDGEAAKFIGRQLADATQFKYGISESPQVLKSLTGRVAFQFGNYPMQYLQFLRESMVNGTIGDKAKLVALMGASWGALQYGAKKTGWNLQWRLNPFLGLGFTGGPLVSATSDVAAGVGAFQRSLFDENAKVGPINAGITAAGGLLNMANPLAGAYRTAQGIGRAFDSPDPSAAILRHLITGETGPGPDISAQYLPQTEANFQRSLQPFQSPVSGTRVGLPPGYFPQQWVTDPALIQNPANVPQGQFGSAVPQGAGQYNGTQAGNPQPQVTPRVTDLNALQPVVADSARALMSAAGAAGFPLSVFETQRAQDRQQMYYDQGRTTPGDTVTWTLESYHTPGRAIDFNGSPAALRWLQQNAGRFGFGVLGARDPGHVEMRDSVYNAAQGVAPGGYRP